MNNIAKKNKNPLNPLCQCHIKEDQWLTKKPCLTHPGVLITANYTGGVWYQQMHKVIRIRNEQGESLGLVDEKGYSEDYEAMSAERWFVVSAPVI